MKKSVLLFSMVFAVMAMLSFSVLGWKNEGISTATFDLLSQNVEALTNYESEFGSGPRIRFCSRKPGREYCSAKRGNRKWVQIIEITFHPGVNGDYECSSCPDNEYEIVEDLDF